MPPDATLHNQNNMGFKEKLRDTGIEGLQRYVSFTFAVAFLCIVSFTVVNYYGMQRTYRAMHKESVSLVILKQTELLYNNQRDMRLSCNLFFTINQPLTLEHRNQLLQQNELCAAKLSNVNSHSTIQNQRLQQLLNQNQTFKAVVTNVWQAIDTNATLARAQPLLQTVSVELNQLKHLVHQIEDAERIHLKERDAELHAKERQTMVLFLFTALAVLTFLGYAWWWVRKLSAHIKVTSQQLKESEAIFSTLFYKGPYLYGVVEQGTGNIVMLNDRAYDFLELGNTNLSGKNVDELPFVHNQELKQSINQRIKAGEEITGTELAINTHTGERKWVALTAKPMPLQGKTCMVITAADITARKVAEERLLYLNEVLERKVQERTAELSDYKFALDAAAIVSITDADGNIKFVNDNFCKTTQYTREEVIGKNPRIFKSGYHTKEFYEKMWNTIQAGNVWRGEFRNKAKDGTLYWADTTIIPFMNEYAKPYQYLVIRHNITDKKTAQEQLEKLNTELEAKVQERTAELQETNRQLESFSYSVSHDLRAPLRNITGFTQLLEKQLNGRLQTADHELMKMIKDSAQHMNNLIDDLLTFSRMGRKPIEKNQLDMNLLVQSVIQQLTTGHSYKAEIYTDPLPHCMGDSTMLQQVWVNLIGNALKYSSKKYKPVIHIGTNDVNGQTVYFIKDNGAGFDMKNAARLFEVFSRLHTASDFEGTGVGLAIVHEIIQKHGGRIWADATPGEGAIFYFTLGNA